jgi:hypothetical protein
MGTDAKAVGLESLPVLLAKAIALAVGFGNPDLDHIVYFS